MRELAKQDRANSRRAIDTERKYKLGQIELTAEEVERLKSEMVIDQHLSASSSNAIANKIVTEALNNKVNKENGKGLSTNDFTDNYKNKMDNWNGGITGDTLPIGTMVPYGKNKAPTNWLICDGSEISRTTYVDLFNIIGTSYGEGDGSTTFNLPNKKGKVSVGLDTTDTDFNTIGKTGGEKTHTLSLNELPENVWHSGDNTGGVNTSFDSGTSYGIRTQGTNLEQPHNNLQPYEVDCWIIKAFQSAGVVAQVSNTESTSTTDTYSCDYINKLNSYSTEEQVIGKWRDGKTLYKKTYVEFDYIEGEQFDDITFETNTNINIKRSYGRMMLSDFNLTMPTPDVGFGAISSVYQNTSGLIYMHRTHGAYGTLQSLEITIEYTKTTD